MRIGYLECFSGISGDMLLGALVDAGVSFALLEETTAALDVGARLEMRAVMGAELPLRKWMSSLPTRQHLIQPAPMQGTRTPMASIPTGRTRMRAIRTGIMRTKAILTRHSLIPRMRMLHIVIYPRYWRSSTRLP